MAGVSENHTATGDGEAVIEFGSTDATANHGLPKTCTIIEKNDEREVYVVGTAHFSKESQEDVALVMQMIQPHIVFIELCKHRLGILQLDEERLLEESKNINYQKFQQSVQKSGVISGVMQILLLSMSAKLTEQLGMAPGGEFRRAFQEAQKIPHCKVVYGDRPINITLQRAFGSLSFFQKLKFAWHILSTDMNLSAEDIEKCKEKDMIEQMLGEMKGEFPKLTQVFVDERDVFLAHSLKRSTQIQLGPEAMYTKPKKIVAVLGIGHVNGVRNKWNEDLAEQAKKVLEVPQPTVAGRVTGLVIKTAVIGGMAYGSFLVGRTAFRTVRRFLR